jgi:sec-independent protein translocase protein TatA
MFARGLGFPELIVILAIILLVFGVGRVSSVGRELGSAISEFRKGLNEGKSPDDKDKTTTPNDKS